MAPTEEGQGADGWFSCRYLGPVDGRPLLAGGAVVSVPARRVPEAAGHGDHDARAGFVVPGLADGDGEVRCFSPVLYAIDTVIPLISLDQRSTWYPDPHVRDGELMLWWLNLATLLGWLLSSIFVLSLARLSRNP